MYKVRHGTQHNCGCLEDEERNCTCDEHFVFYIVRSSERNKMKISCSTYNQRQNTGNISCYVYWCVYCYVVMASKNPKTSKLCVPVLCCCQGNRLCIHSKPLYRIAHIHTYTHCVIKGRLWLGGGPRGESSCSSQNEYTLMWRPCYKILLSFW